VAQQEQETSGKKRRYETLTRRKQAQGNEYGTGLGSRIEDVYSRNCEAGEDTSPYIVYYSYPAKQDKIQQQQQDASNGEYLLRTLLGPLPLFPGASKLVFCCSLLIPFSFSAYSQLGRPDPDGLSTNAAVVMCFFHVCDVLVSLPSEPSSRLPIYEMSKTLSSYSYHILSPFLIYCIHLRSSSSLFSRQYRSTYRAVTELFVCDHSRSLLA